MQISSIVCKRVLLSIIALIIGLITYFLFNNGIIDKSILLCTIIRNYFLDGLWVISFFFIAINFSENITKKYLILTSIVVQVIGIIFEVMQQINIAKGTFDFIDILVYFIAILIACLIEKIYMEGNNEKI